MYKQELNRISEALHQLDRAAVEALQAGEYEMAAKDYQESLKAEQALRLTLQSARTMMNLAGVRLLTEEYEEALAMAEKAAAIFDRQGTQEERFHCGLTIAAVQMQRGDREQAMKTLRKAEWTCFSNHQRARLELSYYDLYLSSGQLPQAQNALDRAIRCLEAEKANDDLYHILEKRIRLYEKQGCRRAAAVDRAKMRELEKA